MSRFLETICLKNRELLHLPYHQARVNRTLKDFHAGLNAKIDLASEIKIPIHLEDIVYKCRVVYDSSIEKIEFIPYTIQPITSIQCVSLPDLDYSYKYVNRTILNQLKSKVEADEILLIKMGMITDSSFSNVAFYNGHEWLTPESPLLAGTCRARLLDEHIISPKIIHFEEISNFKKIRLFNAMMPWELCPELDIEVIDPDVIDFS